MSLLKMKSKTPRKTRFVRVVYTIKNSLKYGVTPTRNYEGFAITLTDTDGSERMFLFTPSELADAKDRADKHAELIKKVKTEQVKKSSFKDRVSSFFARLLSFG